MSSLCVRSVALVVTVLATGCNPANATPYGNPSLAGTWTLVAADRELPNGTRSHDYGDHPLGRMMVDESGRYAIQIYRSDMPKFASGDPEKGTPDEYKAVFDGSSVHYGEMSVDWGTHTLRMVLDESTDPNRRGHVQTRPFTFDGEVLSYRVPRLPDGTVPISEWRRDK
jgi:hypothetical protein